MKEGEGRGRYPDQSAGARVGKIELCHTPIQGGRKRRGRGREKKVGEGFESTGCHRQVNAGWLVSSSAARSFHLLFPISPLCFTPSALLV